MLWAPSVSGSLSTLIGYLERKCLLPLIPKDLCSPITQNNFLQTMLYQHATPREVHFLLSPLLWVANAISAIGFLDFSLWIHESILCSSEWDLNKWQRDLVTLRQWGKWHLGIYDGRQCHWIAKIICVRPGSWPLRRNCSYHKLFSFRPQSFYISYSLIMR